MPVEIALSSARKVLTKWTDGNLKDTVTSSILSIVDTHDHRTQKTRIPVSSSISKLYTDRAVVGSVMVTSEVRLFVCFCFSTPFFFGFGCGANGAIGGLTLCIVNFPSLSHIRRIAFILEFEASWLMLASCLTWRLDVVIWLLRMAAEPLDNGRLDGGV